jgi:hypothetical protein
VIPVRFTALIVAVLGRNAHHQGSGGVFRTHHIGDFRRAALRRQCQEAIQTPPYRVGTDGKPPIGQSYTAISEIKSVVFAGVSGPGNRIPQERCCSKPRVIGVAADLINSISQNAYAVRDPMRVDGGGNG